MELEIKYYTYHGCGKYYIHFLINNKDVSIFTDDSEMSYEDNENFLTNLKKRIKCGGQYKSFYICIESKDLMKTKEIVETVKSLVREESKLYLIKKMYEEEIVEKIKL